MRTNLVHLQYEAKQNILAFDPDLCPNSKYMGKIFLVFKFERWCIHPPSSTYTGVSQVVYKVVVSPPLS
jgi:hypothetical protein